MSVLFCLHHVTCFTCVLVVLGEVNTEGKSLMEQLRGEALKFHKTGEKSMLVCLVLLVFFSPREVNVDLSPFPSLMQERTTQPRVMWSHRKLWICLRSTWSSLVDRYKKEKFKRCKINFLKTNLHTFLSLSHFSILLDTDSLSS